jgi:hypothetical protein
MSVSSPRLTSEELDQVRRRYRWLLAVFQKLPNPSFPFFVLKRLPWIEGVFWAMIFPIFFLLYYFFSVWLIAFLSSHVIFPLSVLAWLFIPAAFFVIFLRIQLGRTIIWWRNLKNPTKEWNVSKALEELAELRRKQEAKRKLRRKN